MKILDVAKNTWHGHSSLFLLEHSGRKEKFNKTDCGNQQIIKSTIRKTLRQERKTKKCENVKRKYFEFASQSRLAKN